MMTVTQITKRVRMHQKEGFSVPFEMTRKVVDEVRRLQDEGSLTESEAIQVVSELETKAVHKRLTKQFLEEELAHRHSSDLNYLTNTKPRMI